MDDHPEPQARSATRAPGEALSRSSTAPIAGSHDLPSRCRNVARLKSGRPSGAHAVAGGAPPVRKASTRSGSDRAARAISVPLNARYRTSSGSASTGTCPAGSENRRSSGPAAGSSTVSSPQAACCSSHSRTYRSVVPVRAASSADVASPLPASARYSPSRSPRYTVYNSSAPVRLLNIRSASASAASVKPPSPSISPKLLRRRRRASPAPCGAAHDHGPLHPRGLRHLAVPDHGDLERRPADRSQGVAVGVTADPGVQEHRVVLFVRDLGVGVADVLKEQQSSAWPQYPRDLGERDVRVGDAAQGKC